MPASLHPEFGPGKIACCRHPTRNAFAAEQRGTKTQTAAIKIQVSRAGIQFITSSVRAPHHPNLKYRGVLFPTIESIVLTILKSTSPGSPATTYQAIGLTNPSVKFSLILSIAARRQAAMSIRSVSRPTSRAIATRAPSKSPRRAAASTAHECFNKSCKAKHEYARKISTASAAHRFHTCKPLIAATVPPPQTIESSKNSAIPPPYPSAPTLRKIFSNHESIRPINRIGCPA